MKKLLALAMLAAPVMVSAQVSVDPYVRKDGTLVQGHMRSSPNDTKLDNWSSKPNVNPTTGKTGSVDPYKPRSSSKPKW